MNNKKWTILGLIVILTCIGAYYLYSNKNLQKPILVEATIKKEQNNPSIKNQKKHNCEKLKNDIESEKNSLKSEVVWNNIHLKHTDGYIYRIRFFFDDGPNGSYKKTILYKEDESGFPRIMKTFKGFERKKIKEFLIKENIIWKEEAFRNDTDSIFWRQVNGKVVEISKDNIKICMF
jgi:hypothetical protein